MYTLVLIRVHPSSSVIRLIRLIKFILGLDAVELDNEQSDRPGLAGHGDSGQRHGDPQGMAQCPSAVRRLTSWHGPCPCRDLGARAIWDQRWSRSWFFLMFYEVFVAIYLFRRAKLKARCVATLHTATTSRFWVRPTFIEKLQAPAKPHPFHLNGDGFGWGKPKIR